MTAVDRTAGNTDPRSFTGHLGELRAAAASALADVEGAIGRLDAGDYGRCRGCARRDPAGASRDPADGGAVHAVRTHPREALHVTAGNR